MHKYPEGLLEFVKDNYLIMDNRALAEAVGFIFHYPMTAKAMNSLKKNHHLSGGPRVKVYTQAWPKEVCDFIKAHYKGNGHQKMANMVNSNFGTSYSRDQIKGFYARNKLDSGLRGDLEKGRGWNKGKKMSPEQYEKCKGTMFQRGSRPHNAVPVGTEVIRDDGYHQTKIAEPNVWMLTHILIWQQANGDVPEGCLVSFKDGNPDHISIDNLFLETRQEHLEMNRRGYRSEFPEITEAGLNVAKLRIAARQKSDKRKKKEAQPMAKRTKENPTRFTASRYKEFKHMDQEQMKKAVNAYYFQGLRDAQAAAGFDADKALEAISQIKGIGHGKLKEIERVLKGAANGNETQ